MAHAERRAIRNTDAYKGMADMDALTDADIRRGGNNPPYTELTYSVSPKTTSVGVSSSSTPTKNEEKPIWFALQVTYGRIERAAKLIRKQNVETFMVQRIVTRNVNGNKSISKTSLIPNVFALMTPSRALTFLEPSENHLPSFSCTFSRHGKEGKLSLLLAYLKRSLLRTSSRHGIAHASMALLVAYRKRSFIRFFRNRTEHLLLNGLKSNSANITP